MISPDPNLTKVSASPLGDGKRLIEGRRIHILFDDSEAMIANLLQDVPKPVEVHRPLARLAKDARRQRASHPAPPKIAPRRRSFPRKLVPREACPPRERRSGGAGIQSPRGGPAARDGVVRRGFKRRLPFSWRKTFKPSPSSSLRINVSCSPSTAAYRLAN